MYVGMMFGKMLFLKNTRHIVTPRKTFKFCITFAKIRVSIEHFAMF